MITTRQPTQQFPHAMRAHAMPVARLQGVSKTYGPVQALSNVDLSLHPGELLAVLGPNGAGKTTALRMLLGLSKPSRGTARVFGRDPVDSDARVRTGGM